MSPNSFSTTAIFKPLASTSFSNVVLPLPKKPQSTVTGTRRAGRLRWRSSVAGRWTRRAAARARDGCDGSRARATGVARAAPSFKAPRFALVARRRVVVGIYERRRFV